MFEPHPSFDQPEDQTILWRYQDLPRYVDMLLRQQLFFSRADKFEDPFEGQYTLQSKENLLREHLENSSSTNLADKEIDKLKEKVELLAEEHIARRTFVTINSWHCNNNENYAMWKIYARGDYGIAIQTTVSRLREAFSATDKSILIGKVNYYDESSELIPFGDPLIPFVRKRMIYQYENELRCCYVIPEDEKEFIWQEQDNYDGIFVQVNLETLIEKIYISPYSPKWIRDIVAGINRKFDIEKEIVHSKVFDSEEY